MLCLLFVRGSRLRGLGGLGKGMKEDGRRFALLRREESGDSDGVEDKRG